MVLRGATCGRFNAGVPAGGAGLAVPTWQQAAMASPDRGSSFAVRRNCLAKSAVPDIRYDRALRTFYGIASVGFRR